MYVSRRVYVCTHIYIHIYRETERSACMRRTGMGTCGQPFRHACNHTCAYLWTAIHTHANRQTRMHYAGLEVRHACILPVRQTDTYTPYLRHTCMMATIPTNIRACHRAGTQTGRCRHSGSKISITSYTHMYEAPAAHHPHMRTDGLADSRAG